MISSSSFVGEVLPLKSLFDKLTRFSSFLRMPVMGFENEIISLMKKMDARRGHGDKALGEGERKLKASSYFNRGIRKLECSVNRSPLLARD